MKDLILALWPVWLAQFATHFFGAAAIWWLLSSALEVAKPTLKALLSLALVLTVYSAVNAKWDVERAEKVARVRAQQAQAMAQASAPQVVPITDRSPEQLKKDFMTAVDTILDDANLLNMENKISLFTRYAALFPNGAPDRIGFGKQLLKAYNCQRRFYQDALSALKTKKPVRSAGLANCEAESGAFFNREKLIPGELAKSNGELIEKLAKGKPVQGLPDEATLMNSIGQIQQRIENLVKLFQ